MSPSPEETNAATDRREQALREVFNLLVVNPLAVECRICDAQPFRHCVDSPDVDAETHSRVRHETARARLVLNLSALLGE